MSMSNIDNPYPIRGTVTPKETGYSCKLDAESEWLTEREGVDVLQSAVDHSRQKYGNGVEVEVVWYESGRYDIRGPVDEDENNGATELPAAFWIGGTLFLNGILLLAMGVGALIGGAEVGDPRAWKALHEGVMASTFPPSDLVYVGVAVLAAGALILGNVMDGWEVSVDV